MSETGSDWIRAQIAPAAGNVVIISAITTIEIASLLARRVREGALSPPGAVTLEDAFRLHAGEEYLIAPLDGRVPDAARALVAHHPLRTPDAIQLASAQASGTILGETLTLISGDRVLLTAAIAEGLHADDPAAHS